MTTLDQIGHRLTTHTPIISVKPAKTKAAVALILRNIDSPEILFIRRAPHPLDPWSGDIGFPGGRIDPEDYSPLDAAIRETDEEIGIQLKGCQLLGQIDDLVGDHLPIIVSCYVFALTERVELRCNHEVAESFWLPLHYLRDNGVHIEAPVRFGDSELKRPAVAMPRKDLPVLWGITYRLIQNFFTITGNEFPAKVIPTIP